MSRHSSPNSSEGRNPVAAANNTIGPDTRPSLAATAASCCHDSNGRFSLARRGVLRIPRLAGFESISPQSTARFRTCRSACVASKRCPSGIVSRHA
jgi:hypothetical protein